MTNDSIPVALARRSPCFGAKPLPGLLGIWLGVLLAANGCAKVQQGTTTTHDASSTTDASSAQTDVTVSGIDGPARGALEGGLVYSDALSADDAGEACANALHAVVRDFRGQVVVATEPKHPDFEYVVAEDKGIVAARLGSDDKPVYAHAGGTTPTTNGADAFNQWYRDVDGVNLRFEIDLPLTPDPARPGTFVYDTDEYFPIDDKGFGNQYQSHNFDFTSELHFNFSYKGGEKFTFRGDDDLWLFVNGNLAVDLGGVHSAQTGTVDMDAMAGQFGLSKNGVYRMDIFQAERHLAGSTFHVETTLKCISNIVIP